MRDLRTLTQLGLIREHRVSAQEKAVQAALKKVDVSDQALKSAQKTLTEFVTKLPTMIDALYLGCINQTVGKEAIEDARQKELGLLAKKGEYAKHEQDRQEELIQSQRELLAAKQQLHIEQRKYEGLQTLVKDEHKKARQMHERIQNKRLDEFASSQYACKDM